MIYEMLFIGGYIGSITNTFKKSKKIIFVLFIFLLLALFILSAFRDLSVGYDTLGDGIYRLGHFDFFEQIRTGTRKFYEFKEPGYTFLSFIVTKLGGNFHHFLMVYAFISVIVLYKIIIKNSRYVFISLYVYYAYYFLGNNMAKLRQSMAVLFLVLAVTYFIEKRKKLYILFGLIAVTFHTSAILVFFIPLILKIQFKRNYMIIILLTSILLDRLGLIRIAYTSIIGTILGNVNFLGLSRAASYIDSTHFVSEGGLIGYAYQVLQATLVIIFINRIKKIGKKEYEITKIYFVGLIMQILFFNLAMLASRISMGFIMLEIFVITYLFSSIKEQNLKIIFVVYFFIIIFFRGYLNFLGNYSAFVPYKFYFQ